MLLSYSLADEAATIDLGGGLTRAIETVGLGDGLNIHLLGDLGAGKTTFSRGVVRAFGHQGAVKSPTYTLVEPYEIAIDGDVIRRVYHFDLYRLSDPAELEFLGLDDYFNSSSLCLIEWPERGVGFMPQADIEIHLVELSSKARQFNFAALTVRGEQVLRALDKYDQ